MNRHLIKTIIAISALSFCIVSCDGNRLEKEITNVENGLLPMIIIQGEPSYNILERMKYYNVPGISIAIINDYKITWTKYYGVSDAETQKPVNENTIFNIGSLSKGVSSLGILSLVEEGKIDLDKDINLQLRDWKYPENEFTKDHKPTPRLLLNHSGGACHSWGYAYTLENIPSLLQILNGESPSQSTPVIIDRVPRTEFLYSNPGYTIMEQLATEVEDESFSKIITDKVLIPLHMTKSFFADPISTEMLKVASSAHNDSGKNFPIKQYCLGTLAPGGLWTTAEDYAKYVIELQKSYHGNSNKIISQELTEEMLKPHVSLQYGLGVFMRYINDETYFGHMGDTRGFFAGYISHLTDGYGVVILTNAKGGAQLVLEIMKSVAKEYAWEGYLKAKKEIIKLDESEINAITGKYMDGSDGALKIFSQDNKLYLRTTTEYELFPIGNKEFVVKDLDGSLKLTNNEEGELILKYELSDNLGRFLNNHDCKKVADDFKTPMELLMDGQFEEARKIYLKIYNKNPKDFAVSENRLNRLAYEFMNTSKYDQAIETLLTGILIYNNSANLYDSLGEAYALKGNKKNAIKSYKKSLELNPENQNAKKMLEKLLNS